jgi:hypothetical protein
MIRVVDFTGRTHYLAAQNIARITEAGASSQWHGIRSFVRTNDGQTIEATETADQIAALVTKAEHAERYTWLRERDLSTVHQGGVFAGRTPENVVLNGADLDAAIDAERARTRL